MPHHLQQIRSHAEETYPEECCGLLIGTIEQSGATDFNRLVEVWRTPNAWSFDVAAMTDPTTALSLHTKGDRYWIDPVDLLKAQRYARDRHLHVIGIYHSHPDHPAVPSECDRVLAWPRYSYLIVSVQQGITQDLLCWKLDETHQFQPESLDGPSVSSSALRS